MKVFIVLALTLIWTKMSMAKDPICTYEADIIFVLDGTIIWGFVDRQKLFVSSFSDGLTADTRFGAVLFSTTASELFDLDTYSKQDISQALDSIRYTHGLTNTHLGLNMAQSMMKKARPTATKVVIVVTDEVSENPAETKQAAIKLENDNVTIFVVDIGQSSEPEFQNIASQSDYAFKGGQNSKIKRILNSDFIGETCQADPPSPPCPNGEVIGSQCFTFNSQRMTQADAADSCAANGGEILAVKTEEMYIQLGNFSNTEGVKLWAGAEEAAEGNWRWISDKTSANIQKKWFQRGEPNNWRGNEECLQMQPNKKLNDASCCKRFAFVCVT